MIIETILNSIAIIYLLLVSILFLLGPLSDLNINGLYLLFVSSKESFEQEFMRVR